MLRRPHSLLVSMVSPRDVRWAGRSRKVVAVGVAEVTSGTTLSSPPFSQMKRRWVSPGGVRRQSGDEKVSPGKALTRAKAVDGGEAGTLRLGFASRRVEAKFRVTTAVVVWPVVLAMR